MITVEKLDKLTDVVRVFLEKDPQCRIDDNRLAARVEAHYNPNIQFASYLEVRENRYKYTIYSTESITRARRKVQEEFPELLPTREQLESRITEEAEYRRFARRGIRRRHAKDGKE